MSTRLFYFFSVFLSGLVIMAVEMTSSRLLAPYFGSSLVVWTNVIGLVMIALTLGYYLGGHLADRRPSRLLYFSLLLFAGAWIMITPFLSAFLFPILFSSFSDLSGLLIFGSFLSAFVFLGLPMMLLGMTLPLTLKLINEKRSEIGRDSGRVSASSTVGSILGTFLPAFLLIPTFGIIKTFFLLGFVLIFLAAVGLRKIWAILIVLLSLLVFWSDPKVFFLEEEMTYVHQEESLYSGIYVIEDPSGLLYLQMGSVWGIQSIYNPHGSAVPAYYPFVGVLPSFVEDPKEVLILGHGGGTFTHFFNDYFPDLEITGVELDPAVTEVAQLYLGLAEAEVTLYNGDARLFLLNHEKQYDLILIDTYKGTSIPAHLATQEFFEEVESHLSPGGLIAVNAAAIPSPFLTTLKNTMASSLGTTFSVNIPDHYNVLLLAGPKVLPYPTHVPEDLLPYAESISNSYEENSYQENELVFTDDKLTIVELLGEEMQLELLSKIKL